MTNTKTFSVTKNGQPLDPSLYTWDEKTRTFSTDESSLVLDFRDWEFVTFKTGFGCTFDTGSGCTFDTGFGCTFDTGSGCTFKTNYDCTFKTNYDCTFKTNYDCTFDTGDNCTFKTGSDCTFNTGDNCTFKTGPDCTFNTGDNCTFRTGPDCTFNTDDNCTFTTGSVCTFKTTSGCTFKTGFDCAFTTGYNCTFDTDSDCTFNTGDNCTFDTYPNCTFKTGSNCTFKTNFGCKFKTGADCTFKTTSGCTFDTCSDCTFYTGFGCTFKTGDNCVIARRDIFQVIQPLKNEIVQFCPYSISGYISKREGENAFYMDIDGKRVEHIIADGILSEVVKKRGNVYHVKNHGCKDVTYLIQDGDKYSHGDTLKEAKENLMYKISNRDTSKYKDFTLDTELTLGEAIEMYRTIAGACESGTRYFCEHILSPERKNSQKKYTVKEVIELTQGQYKHNLLVEFFEKGNKEND